MKFEEISNETDEINKKNDKLRKKLKSCSRRVADLKEEQNFEPANKELTNLLLKMRGNAFLLKKNRKKVERLRKKTRNIFSEIRKIIKKLPPSAKRRDFILFLREKKEEMKIDHRDIEKLLKNSRRIIKICGNYEKFNMELKRILFERVDQLILRIGELEKKEEDDDERIVELLFLKNELIKTKYKLNYD
jgi:hypothetical protein